MAVPKKRNSKRITRTNKSIWYKKILPKIKKALSLGKTLI
jgi:ribosomal protein L32